MITPAHKIMAWGLSALGLTPKDSNGDGNISDEKPVIKTPGWLGVVAGVGDVVVNADRDVAGMIGRGRDYYNKDKNKTYLDKLYDESNHRIAESPEVSRLKSEAYLDNNITGASDEDTKRIFYSIVMPNEESGNLGVPTYAAYFDGGKNIQSEVKDIGIDEMREIIATKYAMEKAGIPKDVVRDMLERDAQKHVAANEGWFKGKKKFANDVLIAASSYTADKWNGIANIKYMAQDSQDGGVNVWMDENGEIVKHPELVKVVNDVWDDKAKRYVHIPGAVVYTDENGKDHIVHQSKISRSALLLMGREAEGKNAGAVSSSWANPEFWTKAEQYGVWTQDEVNKWDKIGASPYAVAWDPDEGSHIMYDSFKMMSFGLADQALMFLPMGAGALAKGINATSRLANATRIGLEAISKLGPASKVGQVLNNATASLGIGFAYGRSNAYELFEKNLMRNEEMLRTKSEKELENRYNTDKEYKASIDQRIAKLTQAIVQKTINDNAQQIQDGHVVIDTNLLQQQAAYEAYQQVQEEELQKQMEANKNTPEYQELSRNAINTAAYTSNIMAVTDALKYFAVGAFGYRRYLYEQPTALFNQTKNTLKEALRGTKSALKHIKEIKNAEGKFRLSTAVGKDFIGLRNQAKQWGKSFKDQFIGGAWTNGTDDMQVDGVQKINDDTMQRMYDAYIAGEPIADVYSTLDQVSSFMTGMGESLGQKTTWDVTLVGGLGSTISGNLNFANIASLATKEGRNAFKEQYGTRYKRDAEGQIKYKDEVVIGEDGKPVVGEDGKPITRKVAETESVKWWQNPMERLGFFVQNGVLNTYYGNKQAAFAKVDRVQAANSILDEFGDFEELENYINADAASDNVLTEREKRTSAFLKALRLARALEQVGKTQEGKRDVEDPLLASSAYRKAKDLIAKANSIQEYDTGVNIGDFSPEEVENMLKEWYSKNPQETRSEAKDVEALRSIAQNAKELTKAMEVYEEANEHVTKSEQQSNKTFSSRVKNKMIEDRVLYNHWQGRRDKMQKEIGDTSSMDRQLSAEEFIASVGGITNAESLGEVYDLMIDRTKAEDKAEIDKKVEVARQKLETARKKYDNAETTIEKQAIQKDVAQAYSEYDNALANQEYVDGYISMLEEKRDQVNNALEQTRDNYVAEMQDAVSHLNGRKQSEAISRARKLSRTRAKIKELSDSRKKNRQTFTPSDTNELNRLKKQEQVDSRWLRKNLNMNNAQLQQFVARVDELHTVNSQGRVLTADEIMSLDPVTRSKMLDPDNRNMYSDAQLKEIDNLSGRLNMKDPGAIDKIHDIARLSQQMDRVMDSYKRLNQHPEGAALAIETDRNVAAHAAYQLIDRRFAKDIANFIAEFDDKIIVNSTDESNDIVGAVIKYRDRIINLLGLQRFLEAKSKLEDEARFQGRKPQVTLRDKKNAVFQLLRTLNGRILDILDSEFLIEKYRTELDKAKRWVAVIEDIASIIDQTVMDDDTQKRRFQEHIFNLTFWCEDKEDIMRQLEIEALHPTKPEFTAHILNLLDDLEELGHLRNSVVTKRNAEKYKDIFRQKAESLIRKNAEVANEAFPENSQGEDMQEFINNLSEPARKALESILRNSKNRKLNDSGSRYIVNGKLHARVTAVKRFLRGLALGKFDENDPWAMPSTAVGNSLDEFGRDVFNGIYDNMSEQERLEEFGKRYTNSTPENFEEVYKALKGFQEKLLANNQRIIKLGNSVTDQGSAVAAGTVTVVMPDGTTKEIRIAGSLDILAMDNEGNLHIYDFKTYHSRSMNVATAVKKGYDRQLSMYAKLLEEEYGVKVKSINILPVHVEYPAPKGAKFFSGKSAEYQKDSNSNQLRIKEKGESEFKEFHEAMFDVKDTFPLTRLKGQALTIEYSKLNQEDKAEVDQLLAEQDKEVPQTDQDNSVDDAIDITDDSQDTDNVRVAPQKTQSDNKETKDPLYDDIVYLIQGESSISTPWLMREFNIGSERAIRIIKQLEKDGIVGRFDTRTASRAVLNKLVTEINTSYTSRTGKEVTGHYSVEYDQDGFVHIDFDKGHVNAKRSILLKDAGVTKEQAFGRREDYAVPGNWDAIPADEKLTIKSVVIDPNGKVVIETLYGTIEGNAARKILDKAFPEMSTYMQQFTPSIGENIADMNRAEDFDLADEQTTDVNQEESTGRNDEVDMGFDEEVSADQAEEMTGNNDMVDIGLDDEDNTLSETTDNATIDMSNQAEAIDAQISKLSNGTRGKRQLEKGLKELKEAIKSNDPIAIANALATLFANNSRMEKTEVTDSVQQAIEKILDNLKSIGYEIDFKVGKTYNSGDKVTAEFIQDDTLPIGTQVYDSVRKPQISRDGKLVQTADVVVRQNLDDDYENAEAIESSINKLPKDHRGRIALENRVKQLKQAIQNKDHVKTLSLLNNIFIAISKLRNDGSLNDLAKRGVEEISRFANEIYDNLRAQGYKIVDLIGKDYNDGMPFEVQFVPDDTLPEGKRVITGVSQPQINKDGTMVQPAKIVVRQNISNNTHQQPTDTESQVSDEINEDSQTAGLHDDGNEVWIESEEANVGEAESADNFNEGQIEGNTIDKLNESSVSDTNAQEQTDSQPVDDGDTRILPLSANSMPVYDNTMQGPLVKKGQLVKNEGSREGDVRNTFNKLLDDLGIKLQDIIDEEVAAIFMRYPDTPIKFMTVNYVSKEHSPTDKVLNNVRFLVVDYDAKIKRIHSDGKNGRKNNGGVITAQGKEYLIIGTLGYGNIDAPGGKRKQALWNMMVGGNNTTGYGFMKLANGRYFMNPEHNGERFYVAQNENGEFYSTTIKEGSITPGWYVKLPAGNKQPLGNLLSNDKTVNPFGLTWDTLDFGIVEYTKFWSTMDTRAIMEPGDSDKNAGRAFVLIPAGNGKYAPAYLETVFYNDKEFKENSPLGRKINEVLDRLMARNYNDRLAALKDLYKYFYLSKNNGVNDSNIILDKHRNIIKVFKAGKPIGEFNLDSSDFDRMEFKRFIKQEMNPRINITPRVLSDAILLKEYNDSGALLIDLAMLKTVGSNYEVWPVGMDNQVLKPDEPMSQHKIESDRTTGIQIPYMGQYYHIDSDSIYRNQNGEEVTDAKTIEDLKINQRINESGLQHVAFANNKATYILDQSLENPLVVEVDTSTYEVRKLDTAEATQVIRDEINKREQESRDKAAQDALDEEVQKLVDETNPPQPESETPGQTRNRELKEIEEASYNRSVDGIVNKGDYQNIDTEIIKSNIADLEKIINNPVISEEEKAEFKGIVRALYEEVERREQKDEKPQSSKQPEPKSINQQDNSTGTITFLDMLGNKNYLGRIMEALKNKPDAPRQKDKLVEYLRSKNIEVDAIGNTQEDIDAWFETLINCR